MKKTNLFCILYECLPARMSGYHVCSWCPWRPAEGVGWPGTRLIGCCEPTDCRGCWKWDSDPLEEQQVARLPAGPSLQQLVDFLWWLLVSFCRNRLHFPINTESSNSDAIAVKIDLWSACLVLFIFWNRIPRSPGWPQVGCIAKDGLKVPLPVPPACWDDRHALPSPVLWTDFYIHIFYIVAATVHSIPFEEGVSLEDLVLWRGTLFQMSMLLAAVLLCFPFSKSVFILFWPWPTKGGTVEVTAPRRHNQGCSEYIILQQ